MGFRRFTSKSRVLFVNSDFFLVFGFNMKFVSLLLCLFIIASQGRVLREKRETEESLVDVVAEEQEKDTVEKKDEGLNNDSLEDVKARGPALSKLVKAIVKQIPDGAVQKVKDAAVELVKGTVKKHLGLEGGDSIPEEPAKDIVVESDVKEGDTNENLESLPEKQSEEDEDEDEEGEVKQKRDADEEEDEDKEEKEVKQKRDVDEEEDEDKEEKEVKQKHDVDEEEDEDKEEKEVKQKRDVDEDQNEDEDEDEDEDEEGEVKQKRDDDKEVDEDTQKGLGCNPCMNGPSQVYVY